MMSKNFKQTTFGESEPKNIDKWILSEFSAGGVCEQIARAKIEERYKHITEVSDLFNRQSVSYQLSKKDHIHRWLKYKEGFSADLVDNLLKEMKIDSGGWVLDPFLGSGTTSMVCKLRGINSIGFDILPTSKVVVDAKNSIFNYDLNELEDARAWVMDYVLPTDYDGTINHINITDGAYTREIDRELAYVSEWNRNSKFSEELKNLIKLCVLNTLEQVSYTAKDGQYLRWDYRSKKIMEGNKKRVEQGKKPMVIRLDKGRIPTVKEVLIVELGQVIHDIRSVQLGKRYEDNDAQLSFIGGSVLFNTLDLDSEFLDGVITSPPYCNRYDYTRTYALELAYLDLDRENVNELRQELLTCTVENRSKLEKLKEYYISKDKTEDYEKVLNLVNNNEVLNEINSALKKRADLGEINNKGVISMVYGYFLELTFVYNELYRMCKTGAHVAFVNDNVRYAGEVVPVDYISTYIAESIGFKPIKVYALQQQKGNSSQQMKKYGRVALRKSITLWRK